MQRCLSFNSRIKSNPLILSPLVLLISRNKSLGRVLMSCQVFSNLIFYAAVLMPLSQEYEPFYSRYFRNETRDWQSEDNQQEGSQSLGLNLEFRILKYQIAVLINSKTMHLKIVKLRSRSRSVEGQGAGQIKVNRNQWCHFVSLKTLLLLYCRDRLKKLTQVHVNYLC